MSRRPSSSTPVVRIRVRSAAGPVAGEGVPWNCGANIMLLKYKNKTGYKRRQGHRQFLTQLRVTAIEKG